MYTFYVDNSKFYISDKTLDQYKDSLFYKVIKQNKKHDKIKFVNNKIYIDACEDSFKYIIQFMRGYQDEYIYNDLNLLRKIRFDASEFGIKNLEEYISQSGGSIDNNTIHTDTLRLSDTETIGFNDDKQSIKLDFDKNIEFSDTLHIDDLINSSNEKLNIKNEINKNEVITNSESSHESLDKIIDEIEDGLKNDYGEPTNNQKTYYQKINLSENSKKILEKDENNNIEKIGELDVEKLFETEEENEEQHQGGYYNENNEYSDNNSYILDTSVVFSNDKNKINTFLSSLHNKLASPEVINVMNLISTDSNIKKVLSDYHALMYNDDSDNMNPETENNEIKKFYSELNEKTNQEITSNSSEKLKTRYVLMN